MREPTTALSAGGCCWQSAITRNHSRVPPTVFESDRRVFEFKTYKMPSLIACKRANALLRRQNISNLPKFCSICSNTAVILTCTKNNPFQDLSPHTDISKAPFRPKISLLSSKGHLPSVLRSPIDKMPACSFSTTTEQS